MVFEREDCRALIVSRSHNTVQQLQSILSANQINKMYYADNSGKARQIAMEHKLDIVIINTPLTDDFGTQLALDMADKNLGVLIFVKNELYDQISYKVENDGVVTLSKPIERTALVQSIKILKVISKKINKLEARNQSLESKMKEIRVISRAKGILMDRLKMSEEEAHRYIEKSAMDGCVKKGEIAESIIKMYEV